MRKEKELASIIPGLQRIEVRGTWSRAVRSSLLDTPTAQVLYPYGAPSVGARFTRKGGAPTTYLASDMLMALAEVEAVLISKEGLPLTIAANVWAVAAVDVELRDVLDLTDATTQKALGTNAAELMAPWRLAATGPRRSCLARSRAIAARSWRSRRLPSSALAARAWWCFMNA